MAANISQLYWNVWDEPKRARYRARHNGQAPPRPAPYTIGGGQWGPTTGPYGNYPHVATGPQPPGTPGAAPAAAPGNPNPVAPFSTASDLMTAGELGYETTTGINTLKSTLAQAEVNTANQQEDIREAAKRAVNQGRDDYAGRGLAHSSIRDAALYDIDARATLESNRLASALDALRIDTTSGINTLQSRLDNYNNVILPVQQVENVEARTPTVTTAAQQASTGGTTGPAVTWAVWNRWSEAERNRYRDRHRDQWDLYRPR